MKLWYFNNDSENIIIDYMLLAITSEKNAIHSEILLLAKIRYKLSNQMRHFK